MMRIFLLLPLLLLLAACVTQNTPMAIEPGKWSSYHDLLASTTREAAAGQSAPQSVKDAYAECSATFIDNLMQPNERARMDAYARGEQGMSWAEADAIETTIKRRAGFDMITNANIGILSDICPNDIASFRQYLKFPL